MTDSPAKAARLVDPRWILPSAVLFIVHALSFRFEIDDAYISYRYAQNLLAGHGLVFNPGDPVEGYTNFLWVLLSAVGIRLGLDPLLFGRILGLASGLAILVLLPRVIRHLLPDDRLIAARTAPIVIACCGPIACWSLSGLETVLFAFLALLAWWGALVRRPLMTGAIALLLALTRPEGLALGAGFLMWSVWPGFSDSSRLSLPGPLWRRVAGIAVFVIGVATHFLWRHATYDSWLPNTFYAKTGHPGAQIRTGLPYAVEFVRSFVGPWAVVGIWAAVTRPWRSVLSADARMTLAICVAWIAYTIVVGGDMLGMYRFMVPVLPLVVAIGLISLQAALSAGGAGDRPRAAMVAVAVLSVLMLLPSFVGRERELVREHMNERNLGGWKLVGDALAGQLPPGTTLAAGAVGYIPYRTGFVTYDLLGITDRHIARRRMPFTEGHPGHEKHDGAYILSLKPDYMLLGGVDVTGHPRRNLVPPFSQEREIYESQVFQDEYEQVCLPLKNGKHVNCFKRRGSR